MSIFKGTQLIANIFNDANYYDKNDISDILTSITNVKIQKISRSAYDSLLVKSKDILYIVENSNVIELYLGNVRVIGGSEVVSGKTGLETGKISLIMSGFIADTSLIGKVEKVEEVS